MPFDWKIIHTIESNNIHSLEKYFHKCYQHKNVNVEWFNLSVEDIENIKRFNKKKKR